MRQTVETCLLCDGEALVGAPAAPSGGIMASGLFSCETCSTYLVPKNTDLRKLKALSPAQKEWLAGEARKQFEADPEHPFEIREGAILMAKQRAPLKSR